ncbi:MAG: class I SAM-dependent methyltransferase [Desulfobacterales bacterium]|nr:class I SAM-dependent methyltransferase [Desulfobacterales bacterium]
MSYVFDVNDALNYERWAADEKNRLILDLQRRLMVDMLRPGFAQSLLDIGCGTGFSLMPFFNKGIELTGIDPSPYMLEMAGKNLGSRVDLHRGYAENLPFEDNCFNYSIIFLTLEFCDDPLRALEEACRVTRDRIFIGIFNRFSLYVAHRRFIRIIRASVYDNACFLSIGEIRRMLFSLLGKVPLRWRTVYQLPWLPASLVYRMESTEIFQSSPFGGFAGIVVDPLPRFRAVPLALRCRVKHPGSSGERVASCAGDCRNEKLEN